MVDRTAPGVRITSLADEKARSGEPLNLGGRIIGFAFEDSERKADKVTLQLDNFDLSLFERQELMGGGLVEVSWGYSGNMSPPQRVILEKIKGFTALSIEGQALSALMNKEQRSRCFENSSRSDAARTIAKEHGFEGQFAQIQETGEKLTINQTAETDARFLRRLACLEEFEFYVDALGFHFHERKQSEAPSHIFTWYSGGEVLSINVESDLSKRTGRVTLKGRDPKSKTTIESSASNETVDREVLGEVVEVVDPDSGKTALEVRTATGSLQSTAASTSAQLKRQSEARYKKAERSTIKLSMQVVGDPTLHAKSIVELRGISALSGLYYVTSVKHSISSSGYTCDLKLTKDGFGRKARLVARQQQGSKNTSSRTSDTKQLEVVDPETGNIKYGRINGV